MTAKTLYESQREVAALRERLAASEAERERLKCDLVGSLGNGGAHRAIVWAFVRAIEAEWNVGDRPSSPPARLVAVMVKALDVLEQDCPSKGWASPESLAAVQRVLAAAQAESANLRDLLAELRTPLNDEAISAALSAPEDSSALDALLAERDADHRAALATKDLELAAVQAENAKLREAATRVRDVAELTNVHRNHQALCDLNAALALPADSTALREACERVAREVHTFCITDKYAAGQNLKAIVARVLGGAAK